MGLDMYLNGERFFYEPYEQGNNPKRSETYELGYWRKHPNLHGYIVENFADGIDNCQSIYLDQDALTNILEAVEANDLPHTIGFFFGETDGSERDDTIAILKNAIEWLTTTDEGVWRSVHYRASW